MWKTKLDAIRIALPNLPQILIAQPAPPAAIW